jgi:hypothetical protein
MAAVLLVILATAAGCRDARRTGKVTGRVTLDGQPLSRGAVVFMSEDGSYTDSARIRASGDYEVPAAQVGMAKVAVILPRADGPPAPPPGKAPPKERTAAAAGDRFADPETSGIRYEVREGANTFDIALPPAGK